MAPVRYPTAFLPKTLVNSSSITDWLKIATIGPKMTALGDMVFIKAHISPARQNKPRSFHL
jgi:hypothetical protein